MSVQIIGHTQVENAAYINYLGSLIMQDVNVKSKFRIAMAKAAFKKNTLSTANCI
jgi:hypothetical protein